MLGWLKQAHKSENCVVQLIPSDYDGGSCASSISSQNKNVLPNLGSLDSICDTGCRNNLRRARPKSGRGSIVLLLSQGALCKPSGLYKLQYQSGRARYHSNNEIMDVSLQNEPLPSNVSIKSSRYRVTRNLIYHPQTKSSEGPRQ